jgi:hypothetical protein
VGDMRSARVEVQPQRRVGCGLGAV